MIESRMSGPEDSPRSGGGAGLEQDSRHWTDEQLIAHLYGVETGDAHLAKCDACRARLSGMAARRERVVAGAEDVSSEYLMAQRRRIYAALSEPGNWWTRIVVRRWMPAGAAGLALAAGLFYYGEEQRRQQREMSISDAQLAQEVSQLAQGSEAPGTAPLQGLFVE